MKAKPADLAVKRMRQKDGGGLDWSRAKTARLPNLKFSTETISLRLPLSLLHSIKAEANRKDVPYQSLIKIVLADRFLVAEKPAKAGD